MKLTKEEAIQKIKDGFPFFDSLFDAYRDDREVVLAAVEYDGLNLQYSSEELRANTEVVLLAVKTSGHAIKFSSQELQNDKDVYLAVLNNDGSALLHLSKLLRADKTIVLMAVQNCGLALMYASTDLKADREVVLEAVKQDGNAIRRHTSESLRGDKEIALAAIQSIRSTSPFGKFDVRVEFETTEVLEALSTEIRELCKDKDPIEALEAAIRKEKLEAALPDKPPAKRKKTF